MTSAYYRRGFSLIEVLLVLGIISLLAALLLPVLATARQVACVANLHQVGLGMAMYTQDNDGLHPYAVDPVDRVSTSWDVVPEFAAALPHLPWIQDVMQPYVKSKSVFRCPSDIGFATADFSSILYNVYPSSYEKYGTSYYYRTELAAFHINESAIAAPERVNVLFDESGAWHGTLISLAQRYNVLYADGHTKNVSRARIDEAWAVALRPHLPLFP